MATGTVTTWLRRKRRNDCAASLLLCGLSLVAGTMVLVLTFCLFWFFVLLLAPGALAGHVSIRWCVGITALLTLFMFIDTLRTRRDEMTPLPLWLMRECLYIGPRLLLEALSRAARLARLAQVDTQACVNVLSHLAARNSSASAEDLKRLFPGLDWSRVKSQLLLLEGVLFLKPDWSRVTLTQPLRLDLRCLLPRQTDCSPPEEEPQSTPVQEPETLTHYEILGVSPEASVTEIKTAYRARIKECHPDRFPDMDHETRRLAEEWTKALNSAYATLVAQHAKL